MWSLIDKFDLHFFDLRNLQDFSVEPKEIFRNILNSGKKKKASSLKLIFLVDQAME